MTSLLTYLHHHHHHHLPLSTCLPSASPLHHLYQHRSVTSSFHVPSTYLHHPYHRHPHHFALRCLRLLGYPPLSPPTTTPITTTQFPVPALSTSPPLTTHTITITTTTHIPLPSPFRIPNPCSSPFITTPLFSFFVPNIPLLSYQHHHSFVPFFSRAVIQFPTSLTHHNHRRPLTPYLTPLTPPIPPLPPCLPCLPHTGLISPHAWTPRKSRSMAAATPSRLVIPQHQTDNSDTAARGRLQHRES